MGLTYSHKTAKKNLTTKHKNCQTHRIMLIGRRNMANILTFSRKSHNPIENLILLQ